MSHIEAMKQALEALEKCEAALAEELSAWDIDPPLHHVQESHDLCGPAITVLRQAIAEAEKQEPVAVIGSGFQLLWCRQDWSKGLKVGDCLYTHPQPKREPLTDEEIFEVHKQVDSMQYLTFARAIEAAHGIKENT